MHQLPFTLPENLPLQQIFIKAKESIQSYFPVVSRDGKLMGVISLRDIRPLLMEEGLMNLIIAKDIVDENYIYLTPEDTLDTAMKKFALKDLGQLPVVDAKDPKKLIGMLKRTDVINAYNNAILKRTMEE
jgi:CIC family chloride channel protein